jgi:translation initiation factor IF-3
VNDRIRIPTVRVIDENGEQAGIMSSRDALNMARERGYDLVEVSPTARPPVCRIMDYGKFKFEQSKQARKAKKKQHVVHVKEVKFRPKIDDHDFDFKVNNARKFLEHHDKVKFTVFFRGREMAHQDLGRKILDRALKQVEDLGAPEVRPRMEGQILVAIVSPKQTKGAVTSEKEAPGGDNA